MLTQVQKLQLKNAVQRVLHVPGNYRGGPIEMAVVADYSADGEALAECGKEIVAVLKSMGDTFRNVRLNLVRWKADDDINHEISALAYLQTGSAFQDYEPFASRKKAGAALRTAENVSGPFPAAASYHRRGLDYRGSGPAAGEPEPLPVQKADIDNSGRDKAGKQPSAE